MSIINRSFDGSSKLSLPQVGEDLRGDLSLDSIQSLTASEESVSRLLQLLNERIKPEIVVTAENAYLASALVTSDAVNSFGGRFPVDEHARLAALLQDSPVLIGHRKDKLPIGRTFHAEQVVVNGQAWVKSYFYWMQGSEGGASLREGIESGVVKECSLGFLFGFAECSVCGKEIRSCEHRLFESYTTSSSEQVQCHFNYRQLQQVLETSLVYRGAVSGTAVRRVNPHALHAADSEAGLHLLESPTELPSGMLLAAPHYQGIPVQLSLEDQTLFVNLRNGEPLLTAPVVSSIVSGGTSSSVPARLVGMHGKSRLSIQQLIDALSSGHLPRLVLYLYPTSSRTSFLGLACNELQLKAMPSRAADKSDLQSALREIGTRDGIELWPIEAQPGSERGFLLRTAEKESFEKPLASGWYQSDSRHGSHLIFVDQAGPDSRIFLFRKPRNTKTQEQAGVVGESVRKSHHLLRQIRPLASQQATASIRTVVRSGKAAPLLVISPESRI